MENKLKKLPIGIQTFREIIKENYVYVDKTKEALELIENYKYVFLSRPRRFGKSLFLDTLAEIFKGHKELFKGLYIYDKYDFKPHPVIKISWAGDFSTLEGLKQTAIDILKYNQKNLKVECDNIDNPSSCLRDLIIKSYDVYKEKVVVLIDEYDKPILDVIEKEEQAKENREFIKVLYTILKDTEEYIRFVFLTGVSKFSKASIFSGLNMLEDITLNPEFGNICGYTQEDLETVFAPYLEGVDKDKVREWYNGYNFLKDRVYNPFDILLFIKNEYRFKNYWFETGTPSYLVKLIKDREYYLPKLSNLVVGEELLNSFDIENINIEVLLFQSGYLTIEEVIETARGGYKYKLRFPNKEVKLSFNDYLINYLTGQITEKIEYQDRMYEYLESGDVEGFIEVLKGVFSSIPYNNYVRNNIGIYEGYYSSVVYIYLQSLGFEVIGEDVTSRGRIDLSVVVGDRVYIIEFKVDGGEGEALEQIKRKGYWEKYSGRFKEIYLVGIEFSSKEKNIKSFSWEMAN